MKKIILLTFLFTSVFVFAQQTNNENKANKGPGTVQNSFGGTDPNAKLQEIVISKFESLHNWSVGMSPDVAYLSVRLLPGSPEFKLKNPDEKYKIKGEDEFVMGVKVQFTKRSSAPLYIMARRPYRTPGVMKTAQVWISGRGFKHKLYLLLKDVNGKPYEIFMGDMNYLGWKKLTATIPDSVEQVNKMNGNAIGMEIVGFKVVPDPLETKGTQYFYLDDLRVTTDLYSELNQDPDDVVDNW